jgi:geranylgeranyl diphosphate synthase type II
MISLKECQQIINAGFDALVLPAEPAHLYDPMRYMLEPDGKRIRPALVLMGCNVFSDNIGDAVYPAMAVEVFHNFTLMHDDIMDQASMRRNREAVHVRWNQNIAILSGDAMLIKAYELLSKCPSSCQAEVVSLFNRTALEVCEGQQYDMDYEQMPDISIEAYIRMVGLKTAVLVASALKTGAIIGGAPAREAELLYTFGRNIGIAFQLQDDLLDVYADPRVFGKQTGNDIVSNKKTILLIQALALAGGDTKRELHRWIAAKKFDRQEKIRAVKALYHALQIEAKTTAFIQTYYQQAVQSLEVLDSLTGRCSALYDFASQLLHREK